jgi:predicted metal-dependent HD superfamily phosphohydrolase
MSKKLIQEIREYVSPMYGYEHLYYHNMVHAEQVLSMVTKLGKSEGLAKGEIQDLKIAALFHDCGYGIDAALHEEISAEKAKAFLSDIAYDVDRIEKIERLIRATKLSHMPTQLDEMIIRDADLSHLGSLDFTIKSNALRRENEHVKNEYLSDEEWLGVNSSFLEIHQYYTESAKNLWDKGKRGNFKQLRKEVKSKQNKLDSAAPDRGIETMFRVALRNHNNLSQIADSKANILLSVCTIMLSLVLSSLVPKVDSNPTLIIPTIITLVVCISTMYFSIMATRPKIIKVSEYSREMLMENKTNLLFFGNFEKIPLDEFEWAISEMMKNRDLLYGALIKDLYFLGGILARKYRFLYFGYNVFMIGLLVSAVSFIIAMVFYK